jgi:dTDP-glucose 4,6-dehydratase/UDP-glucose 4-epimerase
MNIEIEVCFNNKARNGDPLNWEADIQKIKSMGYIPKVDIQMGINNYIIWLRENGLL